MHAVIERLAHLRVQVIEDERAPVVVAQHLVLKGILVTDDFVFNHLSGFSKIGRDRRVARIPVIINNLHVLISRLGVAGSHVFIWRDSRTASVKGLSLLVATVGRLIRVVFLSYRAKKLHPAVDDCNHNQKYQYALKLHYKL